MVSSRLSVAGVRKRLNWSQTDLADALDVAPLTVRRWEKAERERSPKLGRRKQTRAVGRPAQIPPFLEYALRYLLLKEGKKREAVEITVALPDSVGAALPTLANDHGFFDSQDLKVTIRDCDTGTQALEYVEAERAQIAGAASGLIARFKESVIDMGMVMWSPRAFNVITSGQERNNLDEFRSSIILHPKGSDLENLLVDLRENYYVGDQRPNLIAVTKPEAVERLVKAARASKPNRVLYVAWEPLASRVLKDLENKKLSGVHYVGHELNVKALEKALYYEFRIACSKQWYEHNPSAAFDFMCALSRADLEFRDYAVSQMSELWR